MAARAETTPAAIATVVPRGTVPATLNGLALAAWPATPRDDAGWAHIARGAGIEEPAFDVPPDRKPAAGLVMVEPDGRVWIVSPSNGYAGYRNTFPKGTVEPGASLRATAVKETWEEAGLVAEVTGHLVDALRSGTYTRYYLARRIGGDPAQMGWESQAVHLVPLRCLYEMIESPFDRPILQALAAPFPGLWFCPTGGIDARSAADYLALGNVLAVGGSWLTPVSAIAREDWAAITTLARAAASLRPGRVAA